MQDSLGWGPQWSHLPLNRKETSDMTCQLELRLFSPLMLNLKFSKLIIIRLARAWWKSSITNLMATAVWCNRQSVFINNKCSPCAPCKKTNLRCSNSLWRTNRALNRNNNKMFNNSSNTCYILSTCNNNNILNNKWGTIHLSSRTSSSRLSIISSITIKEGSNTLMVSLPLRLNLVMPSRSNLAFKSSNQRFLELNNLNKPISSSNKKWLRRWKRCRNGWSRCSNSL